MKKIIFLVLTLIINQCFSQPPVEIVSQGQFEESGEFDNGVVIVKKDNRYGIKDVKGKWIKEPYFTFMSINDGIILYQRNYDSEYGYMDTKGNDIFTKTFKRASAFKNGYAAVYENNETIFIDKTGKEIARLSGYAYEIGDNGLIAFASNYQKNEKGRFIYRYVNLKGEVKIQQTHLSSSPFYKGRCTVEVSEHKNCLIDETGKILSKEYYRIYDQFNGYYKTESYDNGVGTYGLIDKDGKEVLPIEYKHIHSEGLPIGVTDKEGRNYYIDIKTGKKLFNTEYDRISAFNSGVAIVQKEMKVYLINELGKAITAPITGNFDFLGFKNGYAMLSPYTYWVTLDTKGETNGVIPFNVNQFVDVKNDIIKFWTYSGNKKLFGLMNTDLKIIVKPTYFECRLFNNNTAMVREKENGPCKCIDANGKWLFNGKEFFEINKGNDNLYWTMPMGVTSSKQIEFLYPDEKIKKIDWPNYTLVGVFSEGIAGVMRENNLWGAIDSSGKEIIPVQYENMMFFTKGASICKKNGKYGMIDRTGKILIECKYDDVVNSGNGIIAFKEGPTFKIYNGTELISNNKYEIVMSNSNGMILVGMSKKYESGGIQPEKYGYINTKGEEIIPLQFTAAGIFLKNMVAVYNSHYWGFIDTKGKEIIPFKYNNAFLIAADKPVVSAIGSYIVIKNPLSVK